MKTQHPRALIQLLKAIALLLLFALNTHAQTKQYFRTVASGNYTNLSLWEGSPDSVSWAAALNIPDSGAISIEIRHSITDNRSSNATVPDFTIASTGYYTAPTSLELHGNLVNNGTLVCNQYSTLSFSNPHGNQLTISGSSPVYFWFLNVNTYTTVKLLNCEYIRSRLLFALGGYSSLDTGDSLTFLSNKDETAIIGNIPTTSDVIGKVHYQRYIPGGRAHRKWRFLAMPIQNQTFANSWQQDIYITGPGINGQDCGTTGNMIPNSAGFDQNLAGMSNPADTALTSTIFSWDEQSNAWRGIPGTGTTIDPTVGYRVFIRGDRNIEGCALMTIMPDSVSPVTLHAFGKIMKGNVNKNLTYTKGKGEGWNLLSNPYPCAVSWSSLYYGNTSISATVSILNPINGKYAYYNAAAGTGTNGGSYAIGAGQSFFVQASANTTFHFTEGSKTYEQNPGLFGKTTAPLLKIRLEGPDMSDEAVIVQWTDATYFFDKTFEMKKSFAYETSPDDIHTTKEFTTSIASGTTLANQPLVFNFIPFTQQADTLPLFVKMKENTSYTFSFPELTINETYHLWLHDKYTNSYSDIRKHNNTKINTLSDAASYSDNRFELLIINSTNTNDTLVTTGINQAIRQAQSRMVVYPVPAYDVLNVQLNNASSGTATVGVYDITGKEVFTNNFTLGQSNATLALSLNNTAPGAYFIKAVVNGQPLPAQKFIKN